MSSRDKAIKSRLTSWLVEQRLLGVNCPEITSATVKEAEERQPLSVHERADRLLKYLAVESKKIGKRVDCKTDISNLAESFMRAYSESVSAEETKFLLGYLEEQGWMKDPGRDKHGGSVVVTVPGYAYLAELEKTAVDSKQAFIAMWFDDSMSEAREAIKDGILHAGYVPSIIDEKPHNNKIDDEIIAEIRRSRFIIADFTHGDAGMRGGVYYEAGFARGLGLEVISTCRQDLLDENKIHFDTRQYNHIGWTKDKLGKFSKALSDRISATIGDGPLKKTD